jgi:hypothetical protein
MERLDCQSGIMEIHPKVDFSKIKEAAEEVAKIETVKRVLIRRCGPHDEYGIEFFNEAKIDSEEEWDEKIGLIEDAVFDVVGKDNVTGLNIGSVTEIVA